MTSLVNSAVAVLGSTAGTFTLSFDAGSTPNRVLHLFSGDTTVTSMTYGGQPLLQVDFIGPRLWELINPPSGVNTLSVTYSGAVSHAVALLVVDNVNQDLPWQWGLATGAGLAFNGITTPFLPTTAMYCVTVKSSGSGNTLASTDGTLASLANQAYGTSKIAVAGKQGTGAAFDGRWQVNGVTSSPNWVVVYRPFGQPLSGWNALVNNQLRESGANNAFYGGQNIEAVTATTPTMTKVAANNGIMASGVDGSGNLYTWGSDNGSGMLGDGATHPAGAFYRLVPTLVSGVTTAIDVSVALSTLFFLKSDGTVWYFGRDITNAGVVNHTTATQLAGLANIVRIDNGGGQNCLLALDGTGNLWFVGNNSEAQAGNGSSSGIVTTPYNVLSNVVDFALSEEHAVACVTGGAVYCWGNNDSSCTGQGIHTGFTTSPTAVSGPTNVIQVSCQDTPSTLVLTSTNQIWHWGNNFEGDAGDGTSGTSNIAPHQVTMPAGPTYSTLVRDARAFGEVYVITSTGLVYSWGANFYGGQGRNGYNQVLTPSALFPSLLKNVKSLAVAGDDGWYVLVSAPKIRPFATLIG